MLLLLYNKLLLRCKLLMQACVSRAQLSQQVMDLASHVNLFGKELSGGYVRSPYFVFLLSRPEVLAVHMRVLEQWLWFTHGLPALFEHETLLWHWLSSVNSLQAAQDAEQAAQATDSSDKKEEKSPPRWSLHCNRTFRSRLYLREAADNDHRTNRIRHAMADLNFPAVLDIGERNHHCHLDLHFPRKEEAQEQRQGLATAGELWKSNDLADFDAAEQLLVTLRQQNQVLLSRYRMLKK